MKLKRGIYFYILRYKLVAHIYNCKAITILKTLIYPVIAPNIFHHAYIDEQGNNARLMFTSGAFKTRLGFQK